MVWLLVKTRAFPYCQVSGKCIAGCYSCDLAWGMLKESAAGGEGTEQMRNSMSSGTTAAIRGEFVLEPSEGEHLLVVFSPADEILREDCVILCFLSVVSHQ